MAGGITITTFESAAYLRHTGRIMEGEVVIHRLPGPPRIPAINEIQKAVAQYFDIPVNEMTSARRARHIARPRQVAMYLARELTPRSLPEIGRRFGWRDHTTVMHAIKQIERLMTEQPEMTGCVQLLTAELTA
jgi:chromosomal replication initiator protein